LRIRSDKLCLDQPVWQVLGGEAEKECRPQEETKGGVVPASCTLLPTSIAGLQAQMHMQGPIAVFVGQNLV
jgi:hypothetical protein